MLIAFSNVLVVFAIILLGYLLTHMDWFSNQTANTFSKLVLNLTLPLSMFLNMTQQFSRDEFLLLFRGMLIPVLSILITYIIGFMYVKQTKVAIGRQGIFRSMFTAANTIFMGLPINMAVFGPEAIPYALLYYMCNTTFFFTIGILLIQSDHIDYNDSKLDVKQLIKQLLSPAIMGFVIGMIWMLTDIPVPTPLFNFATYLGSMTTALSLFVIGIIIYQIGFKGLIFNKDVIGVLIGRYIISPLIMYGLCVLFSVPTLMTQVFILQSAMPVQNAMPILARRYGSDEIFATSCLVYSILSYLIFIFVILTLFF